MVKSFKNGQQTRTGTHSVIILPCQMKSEDLCSCTCHFSKTEGNSQDLVTVAWRGHIERTFLHCQIITTLQEFEDDNLTWSCMHEDVLFSRSLMQIMRQGRSTAGRLLTPLIGPWHLPQRGDRRDPPTTSKKIPWWPRSEETPLWPKERSIFPGTQLQLAHGTTSTGSRPYSQKPPQHTEPRTSLPLLLSHRQGASYSVKGPQAIARNSHLYIELSPSIHE